MLENAFQPLRPDRDFGRPPYFRPYTALSADQGICFFVHPSTQISTCLSHNGYDKVYRPCYVMSVTHKRVAL